MAEPKVSIGFEAKLDEITGALGQLSNDFKKFSDDTQAHFKGAGDAVGGLINEIKKLGAAFLTFEGLRRAVDTTKDLGVEAIKLGSIFGISTTEASQFAVAIDEVHGSVGQVEHAAAFLSRQMRENIDVLQRFGLETKDENGNIKNQKTLFMDAVAAINEYKSGTDRNIASVALMGRGALEMQEILKLTPERLEEAKQKADALGLTLTQQGTVTVLEYRDAMQELNDIFKGFQKVVGEALMPLLTAMAHWFAEVGPAAIAGFKVSVNIIVTAIWGIVLVIQMVMRFAAALVQALTVSFVAIGDAIWKALHGDFEGAAKAMERGNEQVKDIWHELGQDIIKDSTTARDKLAELWDPDKTAAGGPGGGGKNAPVHDRTLMAQLEARLALLRSSFEKEGAARGEFVKYSLEQERDYWNQFVSDPRLNGEERLRLRIKVFDLETQIARRAFTTEIDRLRAAEAEYKTNLEAKLSLQQEIQRRMETAFPGGGPEVEAERKKTIAIQREIMERNTKIHEAEQQHQADMRSKQIDSLTADLQQQFALRNISKLQMLSLQKELEDRRYDIQRDAVNRQLELEAQKTDTDPSRIMELNRQRETLEQEHQNKIVDIDRQAALESAKYTIQAQEAVQNSFASLIDNMVFKYRHLSDALWSFVGDVGKALEHIAAEKAAEKLFGPGGVFDLSGVLGGIFGTGAQATALTTAGTTLTTAGVDLTLAATDLEAAAAALEEVAASGGVAGGGAAAGASGGFFAGSAAAGDAGIFGDLAGAGDLLAFAADGGPVFPNYSYLVGENGPEIFQPTVPGTVIPNGAPLPGVGGDGATHIHFEGPVYGFDDFQSRVVDAFQTANRNFSVPRT